MLKKLISFLIVLSFLLVSCQQTKSNSVKNRPNIDVIAEASLQNGGFEQDLTSWYNCAALSKMSISPVAFEGVKALHLDSSGCTYQPFKIAANETYKISCQAKLNNSGYSDMTLSFSTSNWQELTKKETEFTSLSYKKYSIESKAPAQAFYGVITLYTEGNMNIDACMVDTNSTNNPTPAIDVRIQAEGPDTQEVTAGSTASFEVAVKNTGNVALTNVKVANSAELANCDKDIGNLVVGASSIYTCSKNNVTEGFTTTTTASGEYNGNSIKDSDGTTVKVKDVSTQQCNTQANYTVTFDATWSATTHPVDFPPDPHFSDLVGASHNDSILFWEEGDWATLGIEEMAESGATATLIKEINAAITAGTARKVLLGDYISSSPGSTSLQFDLSQDFSKVTLVSMIAPSPDWFVGVSGLELCENGNWANNKVVDLFAYDAGTDDGTTYIANNSDTSPQAFVSQLKNNIFTVGGIVPKVGTFTFKLESSPPTTNPAIDIRIQAEGADSQEVISGGNAGFEIAVKNTGDVTLANVEVVNSIVLASCDKNIGNLAVGANVTYTCNKDNVTTGFTATATVTGEYNGNTDIQDSDETTVTIKIPPPTSDLVGWWKFDEGSGTTAADSSGNNNTANIQNGGWGSGKIAGALQMDGGNNSIVRIPNSTSLRTTTNTITVMGWAYRTANHNVAVISHNYPDVFFGFHGPQFKWQFRNTSNQFVECYAGNAPLNQWFHLAGTYDGSNGKLYVNGSEICSKPLTGSIPMSDAPFTISGYLSGSTIIDEITGKIDDVRIYNRALSISEIKKIYDDGNGVTPPPTNIQNGTYRIRNVNSNQCIDVFQSLTANGANIIQWPCHNYDNQKWQIEAFNGHYRLIAQHSDKAMNVTGSSFANGANIIQWPWSGGTNNELFDFHEKGGNYEIVAVHSSKCVEVANGSIANEANIQQNTCDSSSKQLWTLELINTSPISQLGSWGPKVNFPIVPTAGAVLPNGKIMMWSAWDETSFGGDRGYTQTALYNPNNGQVVKRQVNNTNHDMFCPGISMLGDGSVFVNGGSSSKKTSIYHYLSDSWTSGGDMAVGRGYNSTVTLLNGNVFTIGGAWPNGDAGNPDRIGEHWDEHNHWTSLPGATTAPMLNQDIITPGRSDEHPWIFAAPNGKVFFAGPSVNMTWYNPTGNGTTTAAGKRADDKFSQVGVSVLYDVGKVLTTGGAESYDSGVNATNSSYVIDMNSENNVQARKIAAMKHARAYATGVVLSDGQVMIVGGARVAKAFKDDTAVYEPELWNPQTEAWRGLAEHSIPRTYHSFALLLPDARVLSAGGGLCGNCSTNHPNGNIYTPYYLYNQDGTLAQRPTISGAPNSTTYGQSLNITASETISSFTFVRMSGTTHGVNTDQRFLKLSASSSSNNNYTVKIPNNNIATPGYWMLFAFNNQGVPSKAAVIHVH